MGGGEKRGQGAGGRPEGGGRGNLNTGAVKGAVAQEKSGVVWALRTSAYFTRRTTTQGISPHTARDKPVLRLGGSAGLASNRTGMKVKSLSERWAWLLVVVVVAMGVVVMVVVVRGGSVLVSCMAAVI